ncbi:hypothetical protein GA0115240_12562 [Streptomyces sp. DvalAA-14]|uniref:hypothetical protein n=1 Tax=unclassified Streptomyces TaxID=2593676 RepID=UPI00081B8D7D|nr:MULTISPECIES: hypothetical protein [unclassified Streptomyces]MYS21115.1 hypothetical protein [Streptomyces sp. SID4948]SCD84433.1 hypothetical protein GA0115240_12562 [Streptomyces sp. DvalAA-14]
MISLMTTTKMTDRSVVAACPLGISMHATGLSMTSATSALLPVLPVRERSERPIKASAVAAAAAQAQAYAFAAAANGAGAGTAEGANGANGQQKTQQHGSKWAFRGLQPWSDPA